MIVFHLNVKVNDSKSIKPVDLCTQWLKVILFCEQDFLSFYFGHCFEKDYKLRVRVFTFKFETCFNRVRMYSKNIIKSRHSGSRDFQSVTSI